MKDIRNVAIIAHVDHGKTTLVDALLRQSKTELDKVAAESTCILDSNDLEKERGITIFSKNASVLWKGTKINIIDTPGHADFGGEVERVLRMADGCLLLIDAQEGPMPQTRFVLKKALELKLKIIVVINKIDKPDSQINQTLNKTFDLFIELGADEETCDFPVVYCSSKLGKAGMEPDLGKKEGQFSTSRQIRERLFKELETDVALRVEDAADGSWKVSGRGELHLAIMIERLRREGYEFEVGRPEVITKVVDGQTLVPYEQVYLEVPQEFSGLIIQKLGSRFGEMRKMEIIDSVVYLEFIIPTKGLFGFRSQFLTDTKGLGIINTSFYKFAPDKKNWPGREKGSLVATDAGVAVPYGLLNAQGRGELFVGPGTFVYKGQVVGQNSRSEDIYVNACKEKRLSNMRSKGQGVSEHFDAPRIMDLESALGYIAGDELVEVTPKSIRIRKRILEK